MSDKWQALPVDLSLLIWNHMHSNPLDLDISIVRTMRLVSKALAQRLVYKLRVVGVGNAELFAAGCRQFWEESYGQAGAWTELYNISWYVYSSRDKDTNNKVKLQRISKVKAALREQLTEWELSSPSESYVAWVNSALLPFTDPQ